MVGIAHRRNSNPLWAVVAIAALGCSNGESTNGDGGTGTDASTSGSDGGDGSGHFSFFVTSYAALQALSGSEDGFGGDLSYGATGVVDGVGPGLRGADTICAEIAERSMPGSSAKGWRAFLSTSGEDGADAVDAIDRVGEGPWYDRLGRVFALTKADLTAVEDGRPRNCDPVICDDFPNEDGVPNHAPDGEEVDNHDMLTGSDESGTLYSATATCHDWTSAEGDADYRPRVGHSWPRGVGGGGPGGGGPGGGGPGGGIDHWISSLDESGCAPGVNLLETGAPGSGGTGNTVGDGGGYGGFYCFALTP